VGNFKPSTDNGVTFDVMAPKMLYYANAMTRIGFIQRLEISSDHIITDAQIEVTIVAASGRISSPFSFHVGAINAVPLVEIGLQLSLDANLMFQISDKQTGSIEVKVLQGETIAAAASWPIDILPANFWADGGQKSDYLALAAFVQPNHPSIRELLNEAVNQLKSLDKSPSLSGYQQPDHVDDMVDAVYRAVKARNITYSNPPASWSGVGGQKIRTPQEVLSEGVGTCLDTAVFFASALEQSGIDPVIAIVPGHAFVGYWTAKAAAETNGNPALHQAPVVPVESIANLIDLDYIRLFETTMVCEDSNASFADAAQGGRQSLQDSGAFGANAYETFFINVKANRSAKTGIYPMPAKFVESNGEVTVVEYVPDEVDLALLRDSFNEKEGRSGNTLQLNVPPTVKRWLDSLLDLSLRNPLINMRDRPTNVKVLLPNDSLGLLEDALQADKLFNLDFVPILERKGNQIAYMPDSSSDRGEANLATEKVLKEDFAQQILHTNTTPEGFVTKMRRINSEAKSFLEETGSNGLYLALGSLSWKTKTAELQSPLILVPVTMTAKNRSKEFHLAIEESGVTPNFSLVEKFAAEYNVRLDGLANLQADNFGVDVDGTFEYVREQLNKAGLNDFRVDMTATLGIFNFSSFRLWKDMLDNWQRFERNPLVKHLIHTPNEAFEDPCTTEPTDDLDALIAQLPISADGSQAKAVATAIAGKTFILQGPPGTGKSQTITNLLAQSLFDGKRVLFVAEKKDALDVVKSRLNQSGIGAFSLDLHDKASTSKAVREQLASVIDILIEADKDGFETALQDYELALGPLRNYRSQLHEVGNLGESVYSAMAKYLAVSSEFALPIPGEFIAQATNEQHHDLIEATKSINTVGAIAGTASTNPWSFVGVGDVMSEESRSLVKELVTNLHRDFALANSDSSFKSFLAQCKKLEDLSLLNALSGESLPISAVEYGVSRAGDEQIDFTLLALEDLQAKLSEIQFPVLALNDFDVSAIATEYTVAAQSNFLIRWLKVGNVIRKLGRQLRTKHQFATADLARTIEALVQLQKAGNTAKSEINRLSGMRFSDSLNLYGAEDAAEAVKSTLQLRRTVDLAKFESGESALSPRLTSSPAQVKEASANFAASVEKLLEVTRADSHSTKLWLGNATLSDRLEFCVSDWKKEVSEFNLAKYGRWADLRKVADSFYRLGLTDAAEELLSGRVSHDLALNVFEKGFYKALFDNLLVVQGLNSFDGVSINNFIRKLDDAHERLRERLPQVLGSELLSRRGFDSSMKIGAIGDLLLAIKQSRSNMPLRTLLSRHWDIITRMTPCVLASPDSAVRFIDPSFEAFDVVVFDEASQIRVANAIGALGRAKSAVVVGDSMQMPPSSIAQVRFVSSDDEENEEAESFLMEPESILTQCENARVPDIMLNWHYRSEDESLIAFSNKKYYKDKLNTLPTPNLATSKRSLQLVEVKNGHFIRRADEDRGTAKDGAINTNPAEAKAIVAEVIARLENASTANDSLGIVTFNLQQKKLIESLLLDSNNAKLARALETGVGGEPVLVKNLEMVQGNERDVILFSVAFSATKKDPKKIPMNFGPIIHQGGEKRLNVAITRARREVKIFCSFNPTLLQAQNPTSAGLIDLADYLVMAASGDENHITRLATRETRLDQHRAEVFKALKSAGLPAVEEVGLSEFRVDIALLDKAKKNRAVLAILLDGPRWHSRLTVSDRDCLPVALLKDKMGWMAVERIWLPNWIRDPQGEIDRIKSAYEVALKSPARPKASQQGQKPPAPVFTVKQPTVDSRNNRNPVDDLLTRTSTWKQLTSQQIGTQEYLDYLHDSRVKQAVWAAVRLLVETEGPVSKERVGKFVAGCFGYSRVVANRINAIHSVVVNGPDFSHDLEGFVFLSAAPADSFAGWQKSSVGAGRSADEISIPEIVNAMKAICEVAGGVRYEQLVKETTRVFGVQKVSAKTLDRFQLACDWAIANERLKLSGDYLVAAS
jgi:SpoU rRNA methylase family enzyme